MSRRFLARKFLPSPGQQQMLLASRLNFFTDSLFQRGKLYLLRLEKGGREGFLEAPFKALNFLIPIPNPKAPLKCSPGTPIRFALAF
jgi:hypothetical protein